MRTKQIAAAPVGKADVDPEFLTLTEAAARLRFSVKTLRRRIRAGLIRVTPEGGRQLIAVDDFYAYVERLRRGRKRLRERQKNAIPCGRSAGTSEARCDPGAAKRAPV